MTSFAASKSFQTITLCTIFIMPVADATSCYTPCAPPTSCDFQTFECVPPCSGTATLERIVQSDANSLDGVTVTNVCIGYLYSLQNAATGEYYCPQNSAPDAIAKSCCPSGALFDNSCFCPSMSQMETWEGQDACICQGESIMKFVSQFECVQYTGSNLDENIDLYACPTGAKADETYKSCNCQDASYIVENEGVFSCQRYSNSNQDSATGYFHCPSAATRIDATHVCKCPKNQMFTGDDVNGWTCIDCPASYVPLNIKEYHCPPGQ